MYRNFETTQASWNALMDEFGFLSSEKTYGALIKAYSEKHRAYHTLEHIEACLQHLDVVKEQADKPREIALALWFHDAVYKPFSGTNEEDSADWAKEFLFAVGADTDIVSRVYDLIILTKEHVAPETNDAKIMLDIDLSILGTQPHIYVHFEKDIRSEYKRVPSFIFKKKRKEILRRFLEKPKIYKTPYFYERLETQARENLKTAIANL